MRDILKVRISNPKSDDGTTYDQWAKVNAVFKSYENAVEIKQSYESSFRKHYDDGLRLTLGEVVDGMELKDILSDLYDLSKRAEYTNPDDYKSRGELKIFKFIEKQLGQDTNKDNILNHKKKYAKEQDIINLLYAAMDTKVRFSKQTDTFRDANGYIDQIINKIADGNMQFESATERAAYVEYFNVLQIAKVYIKSITEDGKFPMSYVQREIENVVDLLQKDKSSPVTDQMRITANNIHGYFDRKNYGYFSSELDMRSRWDFDYFVEVADRLTLTEVELRYAEGEHKDVKSKYDKTQEPSFTVERATNARSDSDDKMEFVTLKSIKRAADIFGNSMIVHEHFSEWFQYDTDRKKFSTKIQKLEKRFVKAKSEADVLRVRRDFLALFDGTDPELVNQFFSEYLSFKPTPREKLLSSNVNILSEMIRNKAQALGFEADVLKFPKLNDPDGMNKLMTLINSKRQSSRKKTFGIRHGKASQEANDKSAALIDEFERLRGLVEWKQKKQTPIDFQLTCKQHNII